MSKKVKLILSVVGIIIIVIMALAIFIYSQMSAIKMVPVDPEKYVAVLKYPSSITPITPITPKNQSIQRGEYLVKVGDCISCHTAEKPGSTPFAGDFEMPSPFGTLYTPNLTPDKETGIGKWTQQDFDKAMRYGIAPTGYYYYPAFPYPYFNNLTDNDLKDIFAYLQSIPAVNNKVKTDTMIWPVSMRFLQLGWRVMFFENNGVYVSDDKQSKEWNRGAYLVEGLGHCAMCHTPSRYILTEKYTLASPIESESMSGAEIEGFKSFNISGDSKSMIKAMPADFVKKWIMANPRKTPMLQVKNNSIQYMSDDDVAAMVTYLKTVNAHSENPADSSK